MRRIWAVLGVVLLVAACQTGDNGNGDNGPTDDASLATQTPGPVVDTWTFPPPRVTPRPIVTLSPDATPRPTEPDLTLLLTATASIANTGDDPVGLTVWIRDSSASTWVQVLAQTLQTGDAIDQDLAPATYSVAFTWNGRPQETCNLEVTSGNTIDFLVLSTHVVVTKSDVKPQSGADLDVATSPVCQAPVS